MKMWTEKKNRKTIKKIYENKSWVFVNNKIEKTLARLKNTPVIKIRSEKLHYRPYIIKKDYKGILLTTVCQQIR